MADVARAAVDVLRRDLDGEELAEDPEELEDRVRVASRDVVHPTRTGGGGGRGTKVRRDGVGDVREVA